MDRKAEARFWSNVIKGDGCWKWKLSHSQRGYGVFSINGKQYTAHRLAYTWMIGPIPEGLFVCHHCDNPGCCRPDHLFLGTHQDNMEDARRKGRAVPGHTVPLEVPIERRSRGDQHYTRTHPEKILRGDAHWLRRMPEKVRPGLGETVIYRSIVSFRQRTQKPGCADVRF